MKRVGGGGGGWGGEGSVGRGVDIYNFSVVSEIMARKIIPQNNSMISDPNKCLHQQTKI